MESGNHRGEVVLAVKGLSKSFGMTHALSDASFELRRGEVHALLGGNGSGKSTAIKILAGVEAADAGQLQMQGAERDLRRLSPTESREMGLHFVHQQAAVFPELSVTENLSIGRGFEVGLGSRIDWRRARRRAVEVLERFRVAAHPDQLLSELGPATRTMVAIARALQDQDEDSRDVLVLDEPTASLPNPEVDLLLGALRDYADRGQSIIYVTHRLGEVFRVCDRATLLKDGRVVDTVEPRSLTHEALVELMVGRTVSQIERLRGAVRGAETLRVEGLTAGPLRGVDLKLCAGEIVGVAGLIGSGRSTLLKTLFGVMQAKAGTVWLGASKLRIDSPRTAMAGGFAYVPENRQEDAAFSELTVGENLSIAVVAKYWSRGFLRRKRERTDAENLFRSFLITAESDDAPLTSLSGGNQQKVILARWLRRQPSVLLLDEPTQGVDVGARAEIYELISRAVSAGATALIASSDFEELAGICDRVLVLRDGEIVGEIAQGELDPELIAKAADAEVTLK